MLLTITTTHQPATALGELLAADPDDVRSRRFPFGEAMVFFPQFDEARCTAAVMLQSGGVAESGLSCLAVVLATTFEQTLRRPATAHPLAARQLPFEVEIRGQVGVDGERRALQLFEPLGYQVEGGVDGSLWLSGTVCLANLLTHLCVLLPVLDDQPLLGAFEAIDRLLASGGPWIGGHPECARITRRFLGAAAHGEAESAGRHGANGARLCVRRG